MTELNELLVFAEGLLGRPLTRQQRAFLTLYQQTGRRVVMQMSRRVGRRAAETAAQETWNAYQAYMGAPHD